MSLTLTGGREAETSAPAAVSTGGWVVLQDELAALSANSTHVAAQRGGHHRNRDNPDLVSEVIASLIRQMRS
jgi:hypothetical protein